MNQIKDYQAEITDIAAQKAAISAFKRICRIVADAVDDYQCQRYGKSFRPMPEGWGGLSQEAIASKCGLDPHNPYFGEKYNKALKYANDNARKKHYRQDYN